MKRILIFSLLVYQLFSVAALASTNETIVSLYNKHIKPVAVGLRMNTDPVGYLCVSEFTVNPGETKAITRAQLAERCRNAAMFIIDVTSILTHSVLLEYTPQHCVSYVKSHSLKVECN